MVAAGLRTINSQCQSKCALRTKSFMVNCKIAVYTMPFLLLNNLNDINCGHVRKMCDALHYLLDNIFIRFGSKFYRQIVGIPMGTNCAPLVADLFLLCYERDFKLSLSDNNQADIIEAFNSTYRYLDD